MFRHTTGIDGNVCQRGRGAATRPHCHGMGGKVETEGVVADVIDNIVFVTLMVC